VTPKTVNRLKLLGIGALAVAPVLGSYLLYWFWLPQQHTNYGALIEPKPMPSGALERLDGKSFAFSELRGRWVFVVTDSGACGAKCEEKLWKIRQVRQAQGKELGRIERVFLVDGGVAPEPRIEQEYVGTWFVKSGDGGVLRALPAEGTARDHIYLVDPLGNLMMRFPPDAEPKRMIKDLGRLLKYSRTG